MHDNDLRVHPDPAAARVLERRRIAARAIRVTLARVYARPGIATFGQWHVIPCLTSSGTIGILDIARGSAWDTGVPAPEEVHDLGPSELYAAANSVAGDVRIDGGLVQRDGATPGRHPTMPTGWQQIALPTWRGYTPSAARYDEVPPAEYAPHLQIRPRLIADQLMTCYGRPGAPVDLAPDGGPALEDTHGWDHRYPWGVPGWTIGSSVSVVDTLIASAYPRLVPLTRLARRSEPEERVLADRMLAIAQVEAARLCGGRARATLVWMSDAETIIALDAVARAEAATCAWEAARALAPLVGVILPGLELTSDSAAGPRPVSPLGSGE